MATSHQQLAREILAPRSFEHNGQQLAFACVSFAVSLFSSLGCSGSFFSPSIISFWQSFINISEWFSPSNSNTNRSIAALRCTVCSCGVRAFWTLRNSSHFYLPH